MIPPPHVTHFFGRQWDSIDYYFGLTHITLTTTTVSAFATGAYSLGIGVGLGEIITLIGHRFYRTYGNIARITKIYKERIEELQSRVNGNRASKNLEVENELLKLQVRHLQDHLGHPHIELQVLDSTAESVHPAFDYIPLNEEKS